MKFRDDGQTYQMFLLDHRGNLNQVIGNGNELEIVQTIYVPTMIVSGGGENRFTFLVIEDRAFVLIEQELIGIFGVADSDRVSEITLVTDVYNQTTFEGANTRFSNLTINSAGLVGFASSGELRRQEAGEIAVGEPSLPSSGAYSRITFVSPVNSFSGDYSFGLRFRNENSGIDNWLVFDDSKAWRHVRRSASGTQSVLANGTANQLQTGAGDENSLEFVSTGDQHKVFLNGVFVADLVFPPGDLPFTTTPMAAFEPSHQAGIEVTQFSDFVVWSFRD